MDDAEHMEAIEAALAQAMPHLNKALVHMRKIKDDGDDTARIRNGVAQLAGSTRNSLGRIKTWFEED